MCAILKSGPAGEFYTHSISTQVRDPNIANVASSRRVVVLAVRLASLVETSLEMLLRVGINATPKLTNLSMFRGEKKRADLKFLRSICITEK